MYDWPEVHEATRELENVLEEALVDALGLRHQDLTPWPEHVDLEAVWNDPDLLLTQTCGYPLTHALKGKVRLLGTPHYAAPGCEGPNYLSHIVVRDDSVFKTLEDLREARAIFNGADSQSGMNALRHAVAQVAGGRSFFSQIRTSGSHLASAIAVAKGEADVACLDAVCWWLIGNERRDLAARLRPIAQTAAVPGLPLITSSRVDDEEAEAMTDVLEAVLTSPQTHTCRERLGICGFSRTSVQDYDGILKMEVEAARRGYPSLA
ncbi:PhnD/SsuA/transferrin family substrate-binding protein [Rhodobacterales bacterium]|nr:PhnD/SsuA/transferrin family substrate-binding protein [Rhodobacterales bacterium]